MKKIIILIILLSLLLATGCAGISNKGGDVERLYGKSYVRDKGPWEVETPIVDKSEGRVKNIALSSDAIDRHIIKSGESFSFNGIVGKESVERGYEEGAAFYDGDEVMSAGGGICQTATTLYLCAKEAGLNIVSVTPHEEKVSYAGYDNAAVAYGEIDLIIENNRDFDVEIRMDVSDDYIKCTLLPT
jgi:vancomycin resistance protein YoaR